MDEKRVDSSLNWSDWMPHNECWRGNKLPERPGLYRIRRVGGEVLDYVGQTGGGSSNLRERLGKQRGVYGVEMPYTAPHTAAPALWALRQDLSCEFEVSVAVVESSDQIRKAYEALIVSMHRQTFSRSPTANFGRISSGWRKSSGRSGKLQAAGKQFRGSRCDTAEYHHQPGIAPAGPLCEDIYGLAWCGHAWSNWVSISEARRSLNSGAKGLYRLRSRASSSLVYIGEGLIASRLLEHEKSARLSDTRKATAFAAAEDLEASWVVNQSWSKTQRLELEFDLIAAHLQATRDAPAAQFGGRMQEETQP